MSEGSSRRGDSPRAPRGQTRQGGGADLPDPRTPRPLPAAAPSSGLPETPPRAHPPSAAGPLLSENPRGTYFAFQGLLMAVLILIFVYQHAEASAWLWRLGLLLSVLTGSLAFLRLAPPGWLRDWRAQAGLFILDAGTAWLTLQWTERQTDLYLLYLLVLFGTALTRDIKHCLVIGAVTSALYLGSSWTPGRPLPDDPVFWLRLHFLWITTILLAILSLDFRRLQRGAEERYRERLTQIERLTTLGQLSGEVAHRIKGPLTTILVNAEVLEHRLGRPGRPAPSELGAIQDEARRCREILKSLLDLGRIEEIDPAPIDLRGPVRSAADAMAAQIERRGLSLAVSGLDAPMRVVGDASLLHEAVAALLQNAVEAARPSGRIRLSARASRGPEWWPSQRAADYLIEVSDDGRGIAPEDLEKVFQPFFTTKGPDGSGLGLSAALRILQKHGGTVEAFSDGPGRGARFTITIPAATGEP